MAKAYFPVHLVVNVVAIGGPLSLLAIGGLAISGSPVAQLLGVEVPRCHGKNGEFGREKHGDLHDFSEFGWKFDENSEIFYAILIFMMEFG